MKRLTIRFHLLPAQYKVPQAKAWFIIKGFLHLLIAHGMYPFFPRQASEFQ